MGGIMLSSFGPRRFASGFMGHPVMPIRNSLEGDLIHRRFRPTKSGPYLTQLKKREFRPYVFVPLFGAKEGNNPSSPPNVFGIEAARSALLAASLISFIESCAGGGSPLRAS